VARVKPIVGRLKTDFIPSLTRRKIGVNMGYSGNILITGTSTGIGKVTALYLDRLGFRVFASVRKESDADALREKATNQLTPIIIDVTKIESIHKAKQDIIRLVGDTGLSGIVNNAGVSFLAPLEFAPLETIHWLFDVNVFGLLAVTQVFLPLVRQVKGRIINISSEATISVAPFHGPYSASKLAIQGFSDALRRELKPFGVNVSVIIPGSIGTPMWEKDVPDQVNRQQPQDATELYGKQFNKLREFFERLKRHGISPDIVARTIATALTAKRPKHYYFVGSDAHVLKLLQTTIPEPFQDWISFQLVEKSRNW
jgi:NAD(P)-dependent dehydrogenase (short-subunit alcohol dehydrogenase family)